MRSRSVVVDGIRIHWMETGPTAGRRPPLVLFHGLNDCHLTWSAVARDLGDDRRVLMPDFPGHGLSGRPDASYELEWYAHVMAGWMAAAEIEGADLIGHSLGGGVAQLMLVECRSRIRRLALVASGGLGREIALLLRLATFPLLIEHLGQPFMALGCRLAQRYACRSRALDEILSLSALNAQSGSARAFARTVRHAVDWRGQRRCFRERVHEVTDLPPILLVWGGRDPIIPAAHAKDLAGAFEGVRLALLDQCGHYPHVEQRELFTAAVRAFLDAASLPPARFLPTTP